MDKQNSSLVRLLLEKIDHLDEAALVRKKVFNVANLQMYTGWSLSKIYKLTSARSIPFSKPTNGSLFFEREKIEEWNSLQNLFSILTGFDTLVILVLPTKIA